MKILYRSWLVLPHLERFVVVKLKGRMGWSLLSVSVEAEGPSPRPSWPWHFQHSSFWNNSLPCLMLTTESAGSAGTWIASPGFSVFQRGENVLIKATKSARCWSVKADQLGMLEKLIPRFRVLYRSESKGSVPVGVDRHLNAPITKLRGRMFKYGAFSPSPLPRAP